MSYPDSFYSATATLPQVRPKAEGPLTCDVCVIGGGFTGLSTAIELAERGIDVILVEAQRIGWGASGRNGGQVCTGFSVEPSELVKKFGLQRARDLFALAEESKQIIATRGADCDFKLGYVFAAKKQSAMQELEERSSTLERDLGAPPGELLDAQALKSRLQSPLYVGGHYDATAGQIHALKYALALARQAEALGVRIFEHSAVRHVESTSVTTQNATITSSQRVLAVNGYGELGLNRSLNKILPVPSYVAATAPLSAEEIAQTIPQIDAVCEFCNILNYYRIAPTGELLFGAGASYSGRDPRDVEQFVRKQFERTFPQLKGKAFQQVWQGNIGISVDRMPVVGNDGAGTFFGLGFSGQGVALTGVVGRVIAEAMTGERVRFDLLAEIKHQSFPGGRLLRGPLQALGMLRYRLEDMIA